MPAVSNRAQVLADVKTCLEAITVANGFNTTVAVVRRGYHQHEDFPERPAICFANVMGDRADYNVAEAERTLHIDVIGYADVQPGDYTNLDALLADVEAALMSTAHNPYRSLTYADGFEVWEPGGAERVGWFRMRVRVLYEYEMTTP